MPGKCAWRGRVERCFIISIFITGTRTLVDEDFAVCMFVRVATRRINQIPAVTQTTAEEGIRGLRA